MLRYVCMTLMALPLFVFLPEGKAFAQGKKKKGVKQEKIIYGGFLGGRRGGGGSSSGGSSGTSSRKQAIRYSKKSGAAKRRPVSIRYSNPSNASKKRYGVSPRYSRPSSASKKRYSVAPRYSRPSNASKKRYGVSPRYSRPSRAAFNRYRVSPRYSPQSKAAFKRYSVNPRYSRPSNASKKRRQNPIRYSAPRGRTSVFNKGSIRYSRPSNAAKKRRQDPIRYSPPSNASRASRSRYGAPPVPFGRRIKAQKPLPPRQYGNPGGRFIGFNKAPRQRRTPQGPGAVFKGLLIVPGGIIAGFLQLRRKRQYKSSTEATGFQGNLKRRGKPYGRLEQQRTGYQGMQTTRRRKGRSPGTLFAGNLKVKRGQSLYSKRSSAYGGNLRKKKEKGKLAALLYQLKQLRIGFPVKNKQPRSSRDAAGYTGNYKLRKKRKNMHPSAAYLTTKRISGEGWRNTHRKWSIFKNRLFGNKQQPKDVKRKQKKLRYDKKERNIWENWENTRTPKEPAATATETDNE